MSLPSPSVPPLVRGPVRAAQFVVELVGPRTVPAAQAMELRRPDWRGALGQPELWAMRPGDASWQPLRAASFGSYDSIALAWDLVTPAGTMSPASATHLVGIAERFAATVGRRAIPLTPPGDVPREVKRLQSVQDSLDAGTAVLLISPRPVPVSEFGRELERLGLTRRSEDWAWLATDHPEPLFEATPFEAPVTDGLTLGFRLARCPDPNVALEGLFRVVDELTPTGLGAYDEDRRPLTAATREALRQGARAATAALESVGLRPGSWAALKAFP